MMPVCSISYLFYDACVFYKLFILWFLCTQAYASFYSLKGKPCSFCPQVSLFMRFTAYTRSKKIATKYMFFVQEKLSENLVNMYYYLYKYSILLKYFWFSEWNEWKCVLQGPPVISNSTLSSLAAECCIAKTSGFACNDATCTLPKSSLQTIIFQKCCLP